MTMAIFERWNWENDRGEVPIQASQQLPALHAMVYFDYLGRLYRVKSIVSPTGHRTLAEGQVSCIFVYDYFCDGHGRLLQKRSIDENGDVSLIVDFQYSDVDGTVSETPWSPGGGLGKAIIRRVD